MKRIVLLILGIPLLAYALNQPPTAKEAAYLKSPNKIVNPGAENGTVFVTVSAGTLSATTLSAELGMGARAFKWCPAASGNTLSMSQYVVETGLKSNNGEASALAMTSGTGFALRVFDGTNVLASTSTLTPQSTYQQWRDNFVFPSSGSLTINAIAGNPANCMFIDDAYLGKATNVGTVSQAQFAGSAYFAQTTNCSWSRTNTALGAFGTDADCPGPTIDKQVVGSWQTTDSDLPKITINNLPAGLYKVTATASMYGAGDWSLAISDGTNIRGYASGSGNGGGTFQPANVSTAWFEYTTAGDRSFELYGSSASGAVSLDNNANNDRTTFVIEKYPLASQMVVASDQGDFGWTAGGTLAISGTTSNPTKGTTAFDQVWYRRVGDSMEVRIEYRQSGSGSAGSGDYLFDLPGGYSLDTAKVNVYSTVEGSGSWVNNGCLGTVTSSLASSNFVGCVTAYSATRVRFCGLDASSYGCVNSASFYSVDNASTGYYASFIVPIQGWASNQRAPSLVNSVISPYEGTARIVWASIANTGTPTVTRQSGSWISSITDNGAGDMTINITAGTFSVIPTCVITDNPNADQGSQFQIYDFGTARSTAAVRLRTMNGATTLTDKGVEIMCMGAR